MKQFFSLIVQKSWRIVLLLMIATMGIFSCGEKVENASNGDMMFCDVETVEGDFLAAGNDSLKCSGAAFRSTLHARSGKYSVVASKENPYTMTVEIANAGVDNHYQAEIWRYGNNQAGKLVVQGDVFWESSAEAKVIEDSGWEKLVLDFYVPPNSVAPSFKVFFWNNGNEEIFVDDFKLNRIEENFPTFSQEYLRLEIQDLEIIKKLRKKAFEDKMIITNKKSYVRAIVHFGDQKMPATVRLKGDWLDHIKGKKWSFRIKLDKGYSWRGMRTFNIQTPEARNFLDEWVAHKIAEREDILTTRYEFIPVQLNGENLGMYVYEEHFEKHLVENKNRREGPILKFSEEHLWRARRKDINSFPFYEAAKILPFKQDKTLRTPSLRHQFIQGRNQLNAFRNSTASARDVFDIDKTAKFLAFTDLIEGQHGLIWHNLRFYFNPVLYQLEPIAYDLNSDEESTYLDRAIIGNFNPELVTNVYSSNFSFYHLFEDSLFTATYIDYLEKFSAKDYVDALYSDIDSSLNAEEIKLQAEFENYAYYREFLFRKQQLIRDELPEMKKKFQENFTAKLRNIQPQSQTIEAEQLPTKLIGYFFHIYQSEDGFEYINYFPNDFKIIGYLKENKEGVYWDKAVEVKKYNAEVDYHSIDLPMDFSKRKFRLIIDKNSRVDTVKCEWMPWEKPAAIPIPAMKTNLPEWMHIRGDQLMVQEGNYTVSQSIVIPPNLKVVVEAGTVINLTNGAGFWSQSPVFFEGEASKPIVVKGDENAGFTVLKTTEKSVVSHTQFLTLGTFEYQGWKLTGAVNFYEADVLLTDCSFKDNTCEDALNIIRSTFQVRDCSFEGIFSDAFDSDFCQGELTGTSFNKIDNDAIDFSGSQVLISDCTIAAAKDKGISGGENSQLSVVNCSISACNIAVASKDKSWVKIQDSQISDCEIGLMVFRKKPEYGPATIETTGVELSDIAIPTLIEELSKIILEGKTMLGNEKGVVDKFY